MKLIDGLKLKGGPAEIPDCSRDDLPQFFVEMGFKVGVEIGVLRGEFTEKLCKTGLKVYGIDPWLVYEDWAKYRKRRSAQGDWDSLYDRTRKLLAPYKNCVLVRKTSMDAVKDFEDESLDFVYIDGHHAFKYIAEDLWDWTKKVKKGGIVSGHDFWRFRRNPYDPYACHVVDVLQAYTRCMDIKTWYVLGRKAVVEGERRDRSRSWMFLKQ